MVSPVKAPQVTPVPWDKVHSLLSQQKWDALIMGSFGSLKFFPAHWCCLVPNNFMGYSPSWKVLARDSCWQKSCPKWEQSSKGNDSVLTSGRLEFLIAPKDGDKEKPFSNLENHVQEREEEKWSDDFRGEGHIEDGGAELNILASSLHADSAFASALIKKQPDAFREGT